LSNALAREPAVRCHARDVSVKVHDTSEVAFTRDSGRKTPRSSL